MWYRGDLRESLISNAAHEIRIGAIAGQQQHAVCGQRDAGVEHNLVQRIAATLALKCAAIDPSLTRFSMSGLTQFHRLAESRPTMHQRDVAAGAVNFRAASTAEFLPPTITTRWR